LDTNIKRDALLERYASEVERFQRALNLLSLDESVRVREHITECSSFWRIASERVGWRQGSQVFDFGSGGGLPGLVCAIEEPARRYVLVEQDRRKAEFLKTAAFRLGLKNVDVFCQSVDGVRGAGLIVSRGFAPLSRHLVHLEGSLAPEGYAYLMKGPSWKDELAHTPVRVRERFLVAPIGSHEGPEQQERVVLEIVPRGTPS
jgi:16S rRNA (guanine527-N7)-methyltransferase